MHAGIGPGAASSACTLVAPEKWTARAGRGEGRRELAGNLGDGARRASPAGAAGSRSGRRRYRRGRRAGAGKARGDCAADPAGADHDRLLVSRQASTIEPPRPVCAVIGMLPAMPIYEYLCADCSGEFEELVSVSARRRRALPRLRRRYGDAAPVVVCDLPPGGRGGRRRRLLRRLLRLLLSAYRDVVRQ